MTSAQSQLAIHGGPKAKPTPYGTGQRFLDNELKNLQDALENNILFYGTPGSKWVKRACEMMKTYLGAPYVVACSSGTAAMHLGFVAAGIGPGDEVILTPNTDFGSAIGILEEGAVPVFCDCEKNLQPSAATVAAKITPRTKAVMVIHLAGYPAPVDEIVALCKPKGIAVVEDCAQAWGAKLHGKRVGSFGTAGCFSTNDGKHISAGDGGFVALYDETLYRRVANYADKCYDRLYGGKQRMTHMGVNYRMSELQGAVLCAQLEKVDRITDRCGALVKRLARQVKGVPGVAMLEPIPGGVPSCWWTMMRVDESVLTTTRDQLADILYAEGVLAFAYVKYDLIDTPLFQQRLVRPWLNDERRMYPFVQPDGRSYSYSLDQTPTHKRMLQTALSFPINCFYTDQDIDETAQGVRKVFEACAK